MDANWMDSFNGQHVTILTQSGSEERSEIGTLVRVANGWLQLVKDNGEMVLIPSTAIRLVKLLDMTQRAVALEPGMAPGEANRVYSSADLTGRVHAPDESRVV